ncbi:hypothetical protein [Devosia sp. DBB001]|nr:hypothetical protein [Devosia sp. DBB001]
MIDTDHRSDVLADGKPDEHGKKQPGYGRQKEYLGNWKERAEHGVLRGYWRRHPTCGGVAYTTCQRSGRQYGREKLFSSDAVSVTGLRHGARRHERDDPYRP